VTPGRRRSRRLCGALRMAIWLARRDCWRCVAVFAGRAFIEQSRQIARLIVREARTRMEVTPKQIEIDKGLFQSPFTEYESAYGEPESITVI
jgi:hypothetical protein